MKRIVFLLLLAAAGGSGATLRSLRTGSGAATGTLRNFPIGSFQWSMRFHGLPTSPPGSDLVLAQFDTGGGGLIRIYIPSGTLTISAADSNDLVLAGPPLIPLNGRTDVRMVITKQKDATYGQIRVDTWAGDCTGYAWSNMPSTDRGSEPATSSQAFQLGGNNVAVAFFRADIFPVGGIGLSPPCPRDVLASPAPNMDFQFEGDTLNDVSGKGYGLTASGSSFINSIAYNPAAIITGSWSAPRPVVPQLTFTVDCSKTVTSDGNATPTSYTWSRISGPAGSFSATNVAAPTFTPSADGSLVLRCVAVDSNSNSGSLDFNIGVVSSDSNDIKIQTNSELAWLIGPIPRYGASPWPWFEKTEAIDADVLLPYYQARPEAATVCAGTCRGTVFFSGRGPFTGTLMDTYDVKICATGTPDSYCWRKNGGSYSSAIPITETTCYGNPRTLPVTDGVIICFQETTGHVLNDVYSLLAPQEGTASITGTGNNTLDSATGQVCQGAGGVCGGGTFTVVGTGTHWSTGTVKQKLNVGEEYWFEWDYAGDGSNQGRFPQVIQSVVDDTHITVYGNAGGWPIPVSKSSAMTIQRHGPYDYPLLFPTSSNAASNLNFYEAGLGIIRLAQATNLQVYIDEAQSWCNLWWQYGMDHGYRIPGPRNAGWQHAMACASMFGLDWWGKQVDSAPGSGLAYSLSYFPSFINPTSPINRNDIPLGNDIREMSYASRATALMTHVYPAHTASPSTTRTTWCGYVTNLANNMWLNPSGNGGPFTTINSGQDSYWQDFLMANHIVYPAAGNPPGPSSTAVWGTSPWRSSGLGTIAITEMYNVLNNPSDCNNLTLAASLKTAAEQSASFIWDYGRSPNGGLYYNVQYASMQGINPADVLHNDPVNEDGGAFNITVSGTSVTTGTGTGSLARRFAPCNGTSRIVINGGAPIAVNSCPTSNSLTLASSGGSLTTTSWLNDSTIAVTNGSATVVGTRTGFINLFAPCDGTTYLAIKGTTNADNSVYRVTACADNTHLTLNVPYGGASQGAVSNYALSKASTSSCSPSISTMCEADAFSGLNLAHDWAVSLGQKYQWTRNATFKNQLEYALGSLYGGNAQGPAFLGPNSGPQNAFAPTNFDTVIPSCITTLSVQPCTLGSGHGDGDGFRYGHYGKEFGMSAGAGNARNAIAYYLITAGQSGTLPVIRNEILRNVVIQ